MAKALCPGTLGSGVEEKLTQMRIPFIDNVGNGAITPRVVCAIAFCVFSFVYLYFFQGSLLAMEQHVLSHGLTVYNRLIGALLITLVLYLLRLLVSQLFGNLTAHYTSLGYFPSMVLLAMLTDVSPDVDRGYSLGMWVWLAPLLLVAFVVFAIVVQRHGDVPKVAMPVSLFSTSMWKNTTILCLMMIGVGAMGNANDTFHYRMRMESLIAEQRFDEALQTGIKSAATDSSLTMLRIYALSRTGQLGDKLFTYPLVGGSDAMLPNGNSVKSMLVDPLTIVAHAVHKADFRNEGVSLFKDAMHRGGHTKATMDYMLCGYLLDRDIDAFAVALSGIPGLKPSSLPRHYREALTLYVHSRSNPVILFHDEVMDADYADMQDLMKKYPDRKERQSRIRDTYGNTYWCYYLEGKKAVRQNGL